MPDELHRVLKSRAAMAGMSLSEYLLRELHHSAERPTLAEMRARIAAREAISPDVPAADLIRAERDRG